MNFFKSLSVRLKLLTLLWLVIAVASISYTLLLSWRLEGSAAAINDIGSLRLRSFRIALLIREKAGAEEIEQRLRQYDSVLDNVRHGDRSRPLFLPPDKVVWQRFNELDRQWRQNIRPAFQVAYTELHRLGRAHSFECWYPDENDHLLLAGGLYGVQIGRVFFGESMFAWQNDASKIAFAHAVPFLPFTNYLSDGMVSAATLRLLADGACADNRDFTALLGRAPLAPEQFAAADAA